MPSFPVTCQFCRKPLGAMNYAMGRFPEACKCPKAEASRQAAEAARNTPEAKAKRAAEAAAYRRSSAESAERAAWYALQEAKARFAKASDHLVRVAVEQQTPGYDVLRPSTPEA